MLTVKIKLHAYGCYPYVNHELVIHTGYSILKYNYQVFHEINLILNRNATKMYVTLTSSFCATSKKLLTPRIQFRYLSLLRLYLLSIHCVVFVACMHTSYFGITPFILYNINYIQFKNIPVLYNYLNSVGINFIMIRISTFQVLPLHITICVPKKYE